MSIAKGSAAMGHEKQMTPSVYLRKCAKAAIKDGESEEVFIKQFKLTAQPLARAAYKAEQGVRMGKDVRPVGEDGEYHYAAKQPVRKPTLSVLNKEDLKKMGVKNPGVNRVRDDEEEDTPFERALAQAKVGNRVTLKSGFGYHYGQNFGKLSKPASGVIEAVQGSDIFVRVDGERVRWKFPLMSIDTGQATDVMPVPKNLNKTVAPIVKVIPRSKRPGKDAVLRDVCANCNATFGEHSDRGEKCPDEDGPNGFSKTSKFKGAEFKKAKDADKYGALTAEENKAAAFKWVRRTHPKTAVSVAQQFARDYNIDNPFGDGYSHETYWNNWSKSHPSAIDSKAKDSNPFDRDTDYGCAMICLREHQAGMSAEDIVKQYGFDLRFVKDVLAYKYGRSDKELRKNLKAEDVAPVGDGESKPHKFEKMPGNKPNAPCNRCLEYKSHPNHKAKDIAPVGDTLCPSGIGAPHEYSSKSIAGLSTGECKTCGVIPTSLKETIKSEKEKAHREYTEKEIAAHKRMGGAGYSSKRGDVAPVGDGFVQNPAMTTLAEKAGTLWRNAPNTREGLDAAKAHIAVLCKSVGTTPKDLAAYITKMATAGGRRVNVNWLKNM